MKTTKYKEKKYYIHPKIKWKSFTALINSFPQEGIKAKHLDKTLWEMLRSRMINIGLEDSDDPIFVTLNEIPEDAVLLNSPK